MFFIAGSISHGSAVKMESSVKSVCSCACHFATLSDSSLLKTPSNNDCVNSACSSSNIADSRIVPSVSKHSSPLPPTLKMEAHGTSLIDPHTVHPSSHVTSPVTGQPLIPTNQQLQNVSTIQNLTPSKSLNSSIVEHRIIMSEYNIVFVGVPALQKGHTPLTTDNRAAQTTLQSTPVIVIDSSDEGDFKPKKSQQRRKVCLSLTTTITSVCVCKILNVY